MTPYEAIISKRDLQAAQDYYHSDDMAREEIDEAMKFKPPAKHRKE